MTDTKPKKTGPKASGTQAPWGLAGSSRESSEEAAPYEGLAEGQERETMSDDPDEQEFERVMRLKDPMRVPATLERIEWRLMYGEYKVPGLYLIGGIIITLLALILWRVWK